MELVMPLSIGFIVLYALIKGVNVFESFSRGAKNGIKTLYNIAPTLIGLIVSVTMLKESGALEFVCGLLAPVCERLHFPTELLPMTLLRPVSGGGSTALLNQALTDFGPDSFEGRCASVIAGATETTFYAISVYFGAVNIRKIRHTLLASLMADFAAAVFAVVSVNLYYR